MQNLMRASQELFRRSPDETFPSLAALSAHCRKERDDSNEHWRRRTDFGPGRLVLTN